MSAIGLGIDTTFDDTSIAVIRGKCEVLVNLTLSQFKDHEAFGGVVPERASRKHLEVIHNLISEALKDAKIDFEQQTGIKVFAITNIHEILEFVKSSFLTNPFSPHSIFFEKGMLAGNESIAE